MWFADLLRSIGSSLISAANTLQSYLGQENATPTVSSVSSPLVALGVMIFLFFAMRLIYNRWQIDQARHQRWVDTMRRMDRLIAWDPTNALAFWVKGELYEFDKDYKEAMRCYRNAHRLCPEAYPFSEWREAAHRLQTYMDGRAVPNQLHWPSYSYSI